MAKAIRRVALLLTFSLLILTSTVGVASSQAGNGKYDADGDRLIEVSNLEQLDAIRYDLDGDGIPDSDSDAAAYAAAFPANASETVCNNCNGYELARSLDFQDVGSYASGRVATKWTAGDGWLPIARGVSVYAFRTIFEGNEHTISNLYIGRPDRYSVGLIAYSNFPSVVRNLGVVNVDITGRSGGGVVGDNQGEIRNSYSTGRISSTGGRVGGLVARNGVLITNSYSTAAVSGGGQVGGLVGVNSNEGRIVASYATGNVTGTGNSVGGLAGANLGSIKDGFATGNVTGSVTGSENEYGVGGLVGLHLGIIDTSYATGNVIGNEIVGGLVGYFFTGQNDTTVIASYSTGSVSGETRVGGLVGYLRSQSGGISRIVASYSTGRVSGSTNIGGLVGSNHGTVSDTYWDTQTSGQTTGVGDGDPTGVQGRTTAQLQAPIGYTGIYSTWNADLDNADGDDNSATETDDFWDFGTSNQYPALKADVDGNGTPTWQEFGGQRGDVPTYTPPEAPTGLTAMEPEPTQITFSWTAPSDNGGAPITAYDLRHIETGAADKSDANWTLKEDVWTTGSGPLQYSLTGLTGSTEYDVQVRAVNAAGESEWSPTATETTAPPTAPEAPTGLTARVVSGEARVVLSWTTPANTGGAPITGYRIEASDDGNSSWTEVDTTTGGGTVYTDDGDDGDGPMFGVEDVRHYRVSAVNSAGEGAPSNVAKAEDLVARYDADGDNMIDKAEVIAAINDYLFGEGDQAISKAEVIELINLYLFGPSTPHNRPGAPEGLTAAGNGQTRIDLSWTAPTDDGGADITGYRIEFSTDGSSWSDLEANTRSTSTSYSHSNLTAGSTRHYRVSAINSEGTGPASNVVTGTTDTGTTAGNTDTDRAALGALYNATDGANWGHKDNWQSEAPMGEWYGVTTDSEGRVTQLYLAGNQLSGEIPAELGDLTNLEVLELPGNELTGEIPAELGNLPSLGSLALSANELTGEIPAELGDLPNLEWLGLSGNQLTGEIPAELGGLTNLEVLSLSGNQLTGEIPAELGGLTNLVRIHLQGNQLTGEIPAELGSLTNLAGLYLANNQLTGEIPAELGGLANLGRLHLQGNELTGEIPAELGSLTNLAGLLLSSNQLTGEIPAELGNLTNLEELALSSNQLTGCIPAGLRNTLNNDLEQVGLPFCGN